MPKKNTKKSEALQEEVMNNTEITELEKVAALTNDPMLSEHEILFGDKIYKLIDLPYDDYMKFLVMLMNKGKYNGNTYDWFKYHSNYCSNSTIYPREMVSRNPTTFR